MAGISKGQKAAGTGKGKAAGKQPDEKERLQVMMQDGEWD